VIHLIVIPRLFGFCAAGRIAAAAPAELVHTAGMRRPFAHEAVLDMLPEADERAPGAAITVALCGHWDHQPPCPLAPHHTRAGRVDGRVRVRVLFATEPAGESLVRECIEHALRSGQLTGPDDVTTRWELISSHRSAVRADESAHADRLAAA
jgi:hypothetical protein